MADKKGSEGALPEWAPERGGKAFASRVVAGQKQKDNKTKERASSPKRRRLSTGDYVDGVLGQDRTILGRAMTLVESSSPDHTEQAQRMLQELLPHTGGSLRVGITGVPGAGKSTLIDALGSRLCAAGHKVAVLAVDPSSTVSRGSILGDKTRMSRLSREKNAFIRPSPTGGNLGGVTRKSRETLLLCEAAGFDVILVETVGVGQSETVARSMVDFFLLVLISGAGDDLQGIKRGIMELADTVVVNKADGHNVHAAQAAAAELKRVLCFIQPPTPGWQTRATTCSALEGTGVDELWQLATTFADQTKESGFFEKRREQQALEWVHELAKTHLLARFLGHSGVKKVLPEIEEAVRRGSMVPTRAALTLIECFEKKGESSG